MATIFGEPDISALAAWHALEVERATGMPAARWSLPDPADLAPTGPFRRYRELPEFLQFQGPTATPELLARYEGHSGFVFGNHLFDHRNAMTMQSGEFCTSFKRNEAHLARDRNSLPLMAFPYGNPRVNFDDALVSLAKELGAIRVFLSHSCTNRVPPGAWLDRVSLPVGSSDRQSCMEAACRGRVQDFVRRRPGPR